MEMREFIKEHREELVGLIRQTLDFVPATASCSCPRSGSSHYHRDTEGISDDEVEQWVLNDEALYRWARSEGVREDEDEDTSTT